jgi:uroporphyrinogen-III decarboxylase
VLRLPLLEHNKQAGYNVLSVGTSADRAAAKQQRDAVQSSSSSSSNSSSKTVAALQGNLNPALLVRNEGVSLEQQKVRFSYRMYAYTMLYV